MVTDTSYSVIKQNTDFTVQQGRKIARKQIEKYRERRSAEQTETIRVHTAGERNVSPKQTERGTLPMQSNVRVVGQICPASGRKKKSSPPRPRHEIFVV